MYSNNKKRTTFTFKDKGKIVGFLHPRLGTFMKECNIEYPPISDSVPGSVFRGNLIDSLPEGYGELFLQTSTNAKSRIGKIMGRTCDGMFNGHVKLELPGGLYYQGEAKNNQLHGSGKIISKAGYEYIGNFEKNRVVGNGIFVWPKQKLKTNVKLHNPITFHQLIRNQINVKKELKSKKIQAYQEVMQRDRLNKTAKIVEKARISIKKQKQIGDTHREERLRKMQNKRRQKVLKRRKKAFIAVASQN